MFALVTAMGGDPVQNLYGERPVPESVRIALTAQYHLNDPLPVRYGYYLAGLLQGTSARASAAPARSVK